MKKKRFSINETIKKLDEKVDTGTISEDKYIETHKKLQEEIYTINEKINSLIRSLKKDKKRVDFIKGI